MKKPGNLLAAQILNSLPDRARVEFEKAARDHARSAEPWISLVATHGMAGNFVEAQRYARKAVELAPNSLQGWMNLAHAAQSSGDLFQATEALQRARGLPGCSPDIALDLGRIQTELGKWVEAEGPLREYLSRHPGHQEATLALGKAHTSKG